MAKLPTFADIINEKFKTRSMQETTMFIPLAERGLSDAEFAKRDKLVKAMMGNKAKVRELQKQHGEHWREAANGIATQKIIDLRPSEEPEAKVTEASGQGIDTIRRGDSVTIRTPQGQTRTGKAVMRGPAGWVLNMGGPHGTPGVATPENFVSVRKSGMSEDMIPTLTPAQLTKRNSMVAKMQNTTSTKQKLTKTFGAAAPDAMNDIASSAVAGQPMTEGRCEDYPACGHTPGDPCPEVDRNGNVVPRCVECGARLNRGARSSICASCQRRMADRNPDDPYADEFYESRRKKARRMSEGGYADLLDQKKPKTRK